MLVEHLLTWRDFCWLHEHQWNTGPKLESWQHGHFERATQTFSFRNMAQILGFHPETHAWQYEGIQLGGGGMGGGVLASKCLFQTIAYIVKQLHIKDNSGVYSPKMKGANWLKLICPQGRSLVNTFSVWNIWYKTVVLSLIWMHSLVC